MLTFGNSVLKIGGGWLDYLPPKTLRFDFKYDHFDPTTGLPSIAEFTWTHIKDDIYDFHYDSSIWAYDYRDPSRAQGLFNAYYPLVGNYPMSNHQFDIIDSNLTGVTVLNRFFNAARQVKKCVLKNTGSVTDASSLFYHTRKCSLVSLNALDLSSVVYIDSMFRLCEYLTSPLAITLSGSVLTCGYAFYGAKNVPSGALALYNSLSSQSTPTSSHSNCFTNCGSNTVTGAAELAQIPSSWGGTGA